MLNKTGIKKESYMSDNQILFATEHQVSTSIRVAQSAGSVSGTKRIVKAGTPLTGDLNNRTTGFTKASSEGTDVVGILLHDVDVTAGDANGTLLLFGFVNENRIDSTTKELLTSQIKKALKMITVMAC